jgi:putative endonuclease
MRKVLPYRFVPQTSYTVEQFDRWTCGSGYPPPEPPFFLRDGSRIAHSFPSPPRKAGVQETGESCHCGCVQPCVYILASHRSGTLYIGVTSNLPRRATEHRTDVVDSFTSRYGVHKLVYVEVHATMADAIVREKRLKRWRRAWKITLIEEHNPDWHDLYNEIFR